MTAAISCAEAVRVLWDYLDRGLTPSDEQALEEHLAFCLRCCGELEFARQLQRVLRTRSSATMPDDIRERLEAVIDDLGEQPPATLGGP